MTKVLLVDHSGRGHAFADLFVRTNPEVTVYYAPGCAVIDEDRVISVPELSLADPDAMAAFAVGEKVDFALVANAAALADGFVDVLAAAGVPVIGPDAKAARLESSKVFTKELCARHGIRTAPFRWFEDPDGAKDYVLRRHSPPTVVKADGLCGGNGSFICDTTDEAVAAIDTLMVERKFGAAGDWIVIEDKLVGQELLFFVLVDGTGYRMLPMAVDYPHSDDANQGTICGGMGAFSPHPLETPQTIAAFEEEMLKPTLDAVRAEGLEVSGVLYFGCMLVDDRLHLLEINVRMGEPEAEVILPRVDSDFVALCQATLAGRLDDIAPLSINDTYYCDVVATQGPTRQISNGKSKGWYRGWPFGRHGKNYPITGVDQVDSESCRVFVGQATLHPEKGLVTDGGRCLHVVGHGDSLEEARRNAYQGMSLIDFNGIRYRTDVGETMPWDRPSTAELLGRAGR